jgi:hypothetical protein
MSEMDSELFTSKGQRFLGPGLRADRGKRLITVCDLGFQFDGHVAIRSHRRLWKQGAQYRHMQALRGDIGTQG